jgi:uncharacterized membrane protein SpoIIM required for sporulation
MISTFWLEKRKPYWRRLEILVEQSGRRGVGTLAHSELQELGLLYRQIAADLSTVREDPAGKQLAAYLNQLLGRAHNLVYMGNRSRASDALRFFRETYPRIFRETLPYTMAALVIFLGAATIGLLVSLNDPGFQRYLLGEQMMKTIEGHKMWTHSVVAMKPLASSRIMTNNISVALAAFAGGILAGVGTLYLIFFNGLLLGVVGTACWQAGMSLQLWSFVAPHGVLELPAIFISAGAGLILARGLLFPGLLPRGDSLRQAGQQAVRLLIGVIPILIIAGTIEGFLSPTPIHAWLKLLFGAALFILFIVYLFHGTVQSETPISE